MGVLVGAVILVYGAAGLALMFRWRRYGRPGVRPAALRRNASRCERSLFIAALALGGCLLYGHFIEPNWPQITEVELRLPSRIARALPPTPVDAEGLISGRSLRPVRIVQISDLHCVDSPRLDARLPQLIASLQPDFIVFTGDGLNDLEAMPQLRICMTRLVAIAPVYCVKGNWDMTWFTQRNLYGRFGCHELDGKAVNFRMNGIPFCIAGASADDVNELQRALKALDRSAYCIFLYHYPDEIEAVSTCKPDLYLAGHTHGGQIALPFYGALVTKSRFGKRYESGESRVGETILYVNRGIGMDYIPVRFFARPEITVFNLVP